MRLTKLTPDTRNKIVIIIFIFTSLVLIPLIIYISIIGFSVNLLSVFVLQLNMIMFLSIILGIITFLVSSLGYYFQEFDIRRTLCFMLGEFVYIINLGNISQIGNFTYAFGDFSFFYNISPLFLISIGIPILLIVRSLINFRIKREKWIRYYIMLNLIVENNINTKIQLNQQLRTLIFNSNTEILKDLLEKSSKHLLLLEKNEIIEKVRSYRLTIKGKKIFKKLRNNKYFNKQITMVRKLDNLEYWTEDELIKRNKSKGGIK